MSSASDITVALVAERIEVDGSYQQLADVIDDEVALGNKLISFEGTDGGFTVRFEGRRRPPPRVRAFCDLLHDYAAELERIRALISVDGSDGQAWAEVYDEFHRAFKERYFLLGHEAPGTSADGAPADAVLLQPSEGHYELLAALRAYDGQGKFVVAHPAEPT